MVVVVVVAVVVVAVVVVVAGVVGAVGVVGWRWWWTTCLGGTCSRKEKQLFSLIPAQLEISNHLDLEPGIANLR